jgi:hypothetical protein
MRARSLLNSGGGCCAVRDVHVAGDLHTCCCHIQCWAGVHGELRYTAADTDLKQLVDSAALLLDHWGPRAADAAVQKLQAVGVQTASQLLAVMCRAPPPPRARPALPAEERSSGVTTAGRQHQPGESGRQWLKSSGGGGGGDGLNARLRRAGLRQFGKEALSVLLAQAEQMTAKQEGTQQPPQSPVPASGKTSPAGKLAGSSAPRN